jgi:hypothetical protein
MPYVTSTRYRRFIILSDARTGSHMIAQALDSSPHIICFRELFNIQLDVVQYNVEGYDNESKEDFALRAEDPVRFLHERIFCEHAPEVQAVGFKYHYMHWGFRGVLDELAADEELYVLHLRRRNQLRMFVSLELAKETGVWLVQPPRKSGWDFVRELRRGPRAVVAKLRGKAPPLVAERPKPLIHVDPQEFYEFMVKTGLREQQNVQRFAAHPIHDVYYEEMVSTPDSVFEEAQRFLGLEPVKLQVETKRQNPEPLRDLIENYDELRERYRGTNAEPFFD